MTNVSDLFWGYILGHRRDEGQMSGVFYQADKKDIVDFQLSTKYFGDVTLQFSISGSYIHVDGKDPKDTLKVEYKLAPTKQLDVSYGLTFAQSYNPVPVDTALVKIQNTLHEIETATWKEYYSGAFNEFIEDWNTVVGYVTRIVVAHPANVDSNADIYLKQMNKFAQYLNYGNLSSPVPYPISEEVFDTVYDFKLSLDSVGKIHDMTKQVNEKDPQEVEQLFENYLTNVFKEINKGLAKGNSTITL